MPVVYSISTGLGARHAPSRNDLIQVTGFLTDSGLNHKDVCCSFKEESGGRWDTGVFKDPGFFNSSHVCCLMVLNGDTTDQDRCHRLNCVPSTVIC